MDIMWKRYHESEITPADFVARDIFNNAEYYAFNKSPKNFSGNFKRNTFLVILLWSSVFPFCNIHVPSFWRIKKVDTFIFQNIYSGIILNFTF